MEDISTSVCCFNIYLSIYPSIYIYIYPRGTLVLVGPNQLSHFQEVFKVAYANHYIDVQKQKIKCPQGMHLRGGDRFSHGGFGTSALFTNSHNSTCVRRRLFKRTLVRID